MKKLLALGLISASLMAGEIQFGKGDFSLNGGFVGVNGSTDVTSFSIFEQHKELFSSKWFYNYDITWYDSDDLNDKQSTLNQLQPVVNTTAYKLEGLDVNLAIGRDVIKKSGIGLALGVTLPWIDSENNSDNGDDAQETLKKTKTEIMTYKVGPMIAMRKSFNEYIMGYANATYAYQTGNIKNKELDVDQNVDGTYFNYGFGIRFQPFKTEKKLGFVTLKPKLYFTLGYKYNKWVVKDVSLDVSGKGLNYKSDLNLETSVAYLGVGYSF